MAYKLVHTCLRVLDLDATLDFYCEKLGMEVRRKKELPGADATLAFIGWPGDPFDIELTYNHGRTEPYTVGDGYSHMAFHVPDLDEFYADYKDKVNFSTSPKTIGSGSKIAFISDPDGYRLEVIERKPGAEQRG